MGMLSRRSLLTVAPAAAVLAACDTSPQTRVRDLRHLRVSAPPVVEALALRQLVDGRRCSADPLQIVCRGLTDDPEPAADVLTGRADIGCAPYDVVVRAGGRLRIVAPAYRANLATVRLMASASSGLQSISNLGRARIAVRAGSLPHLGVLAALAEEGASVEGVEWVDSVDPAAALVDGVVDAAVLVEPEVRRALRAKAYELGGHRRLVEAVPLAAYVTRPEVAADAPVELGLFVAAARQAARELTDRDRLVALLSSTLQIEDEDAWAAEIGIYPTGLTDRREVQRVLDLVTTYDGVPRVDAAALSAGLWW